MGLSNERGAVVVLVAVMLLLIFFCVALVVDIGHIHNVKIELQRAVDAAALAGAQELPDGDVVANAVAMGKANQVDNDAVVIDPAKIEVGCWDTKISNNKRFFYPPNKDCSTINAVKVRVTLPVPHFFAFPVEPTLITADAIAVAPISNPVAPLTVVSCIPLSKTILDPGTLPGTSPSDIRYYVFSSDQNDTAAWTGLTFDKNANDIRALLEGSAGRELFEQVLFGQGLANNGIENTAPIAGPCSSQDLDITCGLGMIDGQQLAPPASFPAPSGFQATPQPLPKNPTTGIYQPSGFDPMNGYRENGVLPRWYNLTDDGTLKTDDHFVRIWTLDGLLLKGSGESFEMYQDRLEGYYAGTLTPPTPFNDGRLVGSNGLISNKLKNDEKKAIAKYYGGGVDSKDVNYWPDAQKIIDRAGYPRVNVTNGTVANLLATFFANGEVATGEVLNCTENEPLTGNTLRLQVPVIFAGYCESWKAIAGGSENHILNYVGMADFLLTRGWTTDKDGDFACGDNFVSVTSGQDMQTPVPLVNNKFKQYSWNAKAFEGLIKVPEIVNATGNSSSRIVLVE